MKEGHILPALLIPAGTSIGYVLAASGMSTFGLIVFWLAPAVLLSSLIRAEGRQAAAVLVYSVAAVAIIRGVVSPAALPLILTILLLVCSGKPSHALYGFASGLSLYMLQAYSTAWGTGMFILLVALLYRVLTGYTEAALILVGLYLVSLVLGYRDAMIVGVVIYSLYLLAILSRRLTGGGFDRGLVVSGLVLHVLVPFTTAPWMPPDISWLLAAVSSYLVSTGLLAPRSGAAPYG